MSIFSERLKWLRERKGLTQKDMSDKLDMSRSNYSKYEYGQREPTIDTLSKLPEVLGESLDFIIGVTDFTKNAYSMYLNFEDAESKVAAIISDLEEIRINPSSRNIITMKDFDPDDFQSVAAKIGRLEKQLPLWKERMNISRDKLISMLSEIPMVRPQTYDELKDENGWQGVLKRDKDPQ